FFCSLLAPSDAILFQEGVSVKLRLPQISESGEVVDMAAYEAWQQENHPDTWLQMQRREEVNINVHRERGEDVEPGDDF
uniref:hypothetical protein n=4 Tax=Shigella flexneri TaxID=623 RepID=UPI003CEE9CB4